VAPDDIVELFSVFGPVSVRRMFGGAGIYADDTMFGLIADGVIYLKSGDSNVAMFEAEGLPPFTFMRRGERMVTSYRRMPDRLYDDPDELAVWARTALAAAQQPKPRKRSAAKKGKASRTKPARPKPKRPRPKRAEKTPAKTGRKRRPR
jgi:DNA transformation protein